MNAPEINKLLSELRTKVLLKIKGMDNYLVLTTFIERTIEDTHSQYLSIRAAKVQENSFHIRKMLTIYMIALCLLVLAVWPKEGVYSFAEGASQSILTIIAMGQLLLI